MLVDPAKGIEKAQLDAVRAAGAQRAVLLGGTSAVPASVEAKLKAAGVNDVVRLAGKDRYQTAIKVAKWAVGQGANIGTPVVTTGRKDADALVGAALAGRGHSVLLLVDEKDTKGRPVKTPAIDYLAEHASDVLGGYILGGKGAVSQTIANRLSDATYNPTQ